MTIIDKDFVAFCDFLARESGIVIGENKRYLAESRLSSLMKEQGIVDFSALVKALGTSLMTPLKQAVLDAMTTNETLWFRDSHPYRILKEKLFPEYVAAKKSSIKIWSAACSSGQEAYSIAMTLDEYNKQRFNSNLSVSILGTDLSSDILKQAKAACYDRLSLGRGIDERKLNEYFDPVENELWRIKSSIRAKVNFRQLNLLSINTMEKFDVIFCRNVLIYFSAEDKGKVLRSLHKCLNPKGYLILGGSESIADCGDLFSMVQCNPGIIYQAKNE